MYWGDLCFVVAVHRHGTFSAAARALGVTHTTVARRIKDLEKRYGSQLIDATRDGARLTTVGEAVLDVALGIEAQLLDLERTVAGEDKRLAGQLRLTTCDVFAWLYADIFRAFSDRYPQIALEIVADNTVRNLARREADVAIRVTGRPPDNLVGRRIAVVEHAVYGARELAARLPGVVDYGALPWITYSPGEPTRWIDSWLRANMPISKVAAQVGTTLIMLRAVQAGIGVALLPTLLGDGDPGLERLSPPFAELRQDVWLLTPRELLNTARVRAFFHHMVAATGRGLPAGAAEPIPLRA